MDGTCSITYVLVEQFLQLNGTNSKKLFGSMIEHDNFGLVRQILDAKFNSVSCFAGGTDPAI
jgi:hypothetical protein